MHLLSKIKVLLKRQTAESVCAYFPPAGAFYSKGRGTLPASVSAALWKISEQHYSLPLSYLYYVAL